MKHIYRYMMNNSQYYSHHRMLRVVLFDCWQLTKLPTQCFYVPFSTTIDHNNNNIDIDNDKNINNNEHSKYIDANCLTTAAAASSSLLLSSSLSKNPPKMEQWLASIIKPLSFYAQHRQRIARTTNNTSHKSHNTDIEFEQIGTSISTIATTTPAQIMVAATISNELQQQRCYFYNVDLHGRLYLEEYIPKNITSCIKDDRFLYTFFSRIQSINIYHKEYMKQYNIPIIDYPYISICQNEWNFIRPVCTPIVFHTFVDEQSTNESLVSSSFHSYLLYGGNFGGTSNNCSKISSHKNYVLREPFNETSGLVVSKVSGKLYHILTSHSYQPLQRRRGGGVRGNNSNEPQQEQNYALIRSSVALTLSDRIVDFNNDENPSNDNNDHSVEYSGLGFITKSGRVVPIKYLPSHAEPGPYSMPHNIDE